MEIINKKFELLRNILEKENIPESLYTLTLGGLCPDGIGIEQMENGSFCTYHCKNGEKCDFNQFPILDLAIKDFLLQLTNSDKESFPVFNSSNVNKGFKLYIEYSEECEKYNTFFYEKEIEKGKELLKTLDDEEAIKEQEAYIKSWERLLAKSKSAPKDPESIFLPEWRSDGFFCSKEFKKIEEKVDLLLDTMGFPLSPERDILKQKILKEEYNIDWVTLEHRFVKGVNVIID